MTGNQEQSSRWRRRGVQHRAVLYMRMMGVAMYLASLAGAIDLARTSVAVGVVLGAPALILLLYFIYASLRGSPRVDQLATERLACVLKGLEGDEEVRLVVRDQMPSGMMIRRGSPPTLRALAQWRTQVYSRRDPVGRVLFRCIQPIRPTWQELTRATGLEGMV